MQPWLTHKEAASEGRKEGKLVWWVSQIQIAPGAFCSFGWLASSGILLQPGLSLDFFPKQKNFFLFSLTCMTISMEENPLSSWGSHRSLSVSCRDLSWQQEKSRFLGRDELESVVWIFFWEQCWSGLCKSMAGQHREQDQQVGLPSSLALGHLSPRSGAVWTCVRSL